MQHSRQRSCDLAYCRLWHAALFFTTSFKLELSPTPPHMKQ